MRKSWTRKYKLEYMRKWVKRNREHVRAYRRKHAGKINARKRYLYARNPRLQAIHRERSRIWAKNNPELRLAQRLSEFGITVEKYHTVLKKQGDGCAICGRKKSRDERHKRLMIDHDHKCCPRRGSCGKCLRGLLCSSCNLGLGNFQDSIELLKKAVIYMEGFKSC